MNHWQKASFKNRILWALLLVALVPLLLCSTLLVGIFTTTLERTDATADEALAQELSLKLSESLAEVRGAMSALAEDSVVQLALTESNSEGWVRNAYYALYEMSAATHDFASFAVYDSEGLLCFSTQETAFAPQLAPDWGILKKVGTVGGTVFQRRQNSSKLRSEACLSGACAVYSEGRRIGYVVCSLPSDKLDTLFGVGLSTQSTVLVVNPQWRMVYSSVAGDDGKTLETLRAAYLKNGVPLAEQGGLHCYYSPVGQSGFTVILMQPSSLSSANIRLMQLVSLVFALVCLLFCIGVSVRLTKSLYQPIQELSDAMGRVSAGDLSARISVTRSDEFGQLNKDFNAMTERLEQNMQAQLRHEKNLNDARIRQMQAQLNPHFLYNTLDTMKWIAKINKVPQVASLAGDLGAILRTSINNEQFITLQQELELVKQYINIQKIRFSGRFEYVIHMPDELMDCIVPKLILQPLVENSIIHGLDGCEGGYLYLYGRCTKDGTLEISVTDDGCGMDAETVSRLNHPEPKLVNNHLGIYNVNSILKLYYGEAYGLHASSRPGVGTTVTVSIPLRKEEQPHA